MHRLHTLFTIVMLAIPVAALEAAVPGADATANRDGGPRLRPFDNRSAAIVVEGMRRSERLRTLIEELEQRRVIVYVQLQPTLRGRLAGSLTWITATAKFRYVRVSLSPDLRGPAAIATLGHELQHALEVANEPSIVDAKSLNAYYRRTGISMYRHDNGWDTEAARVVGDEVRQELAGSRDGHISESIRDFDPLDWQIVYRRAREGRR